MTLTPSIPECALPSPERADSDPSTLQHDLQEAYEGRCAISGCAVREVLVGVVINPDKPATMPNTLLLRADIACLFAKDLISVDAIDLTVVVAPALAGTMYVELAGAQLWQPPRAVLRASRQALDGHHRRFALRHGITLSRAPTHSLASEQQGPGKAQLFPVPALGAEAPLDPPQAPAEELAPARLRVISTVQVKSLVNSVAYSPDGALVATGSWDGAARVWRAADGYLLQTLVGDLGEINSVSFSPDGRFLAAAGRNHAVQVWHVGNGQPVLHLRDSAGHRGAVFGLAFAPDGAFVASSSWDRTVRLWRMSDGGLDQMCLEHGGAVNCVAVSPTGRLMASGSHDRLVRLWQARDGTLLQTLRGHSDAVFSVNFSPDGELLASAGTDQTIKLWRVVDGQLMYTVKVQQGAIFGLAFSPDGATLASGDYGRCVRLWRAHDGTPLRIGTGHGEGVTAVAFSPDGRTLVSGSFDATIRFWAL